MYGNVKHAVERACSLELGHYHDFESNRDHSVPWNLVLLLSAEFTVFAILLTPLLPDTAVRAAIENFWAEYSLLALAAVGLYVVLTAPVAAGHMWVVQRWPLNLVAWILVVLSMGSVVHISSVSTDPRGIFLCCVSLASFLLVCTVLRISYDSWLVFLVALLWQVLVFVPSALAQLVTGTSAYVSPICCAVVAVFLVAELRLIEKRAVIGLEDNGGVWYDPFSVSVWINCGTWRFLVQVVIFAEKTLFHATMYMGHLVVVGWQWLVSTVFGCVPTAWWSPLHIEKTGTIR